MSGNLPALPDKVELVTSEVAVGLERQIATSIAQIEDLAQAAEWLARADAIAAYLSHKDAEGPMLGAMRRIEARMGELLGPRPGRGSKEMSHHADSFHRQTREEFRSLADSVRRGLLDYEDDGPDSPWRASRRALLIGLNAIRMGGLKSSASVEWYTPETYIESTREVLGEIDLDPASSKQANEIVQAKAIYEEKDDGLMRDWHGRVFLNPPYGKGSGLFTTKLIGEFTAKRVEAAILLLNAYGFDSEWFQPLWRHPICFTNHRIAFWSPQRQSGGPANANIFVYLGPDQEQFADIFSRFGTVVKAWQL